MAYPLCGAHPEGVMSRAKWGHATLVTPPK